MLNLDIVDDPDHSADDLHQRGNLAFENKDFHEAIRLFTQSVDIDKTNLNIYMDRALACEISLKIRLIYRH